MRTRSGSTGMAMMAAMLTAAALSAGCGAKSASGGSGAEALYKKQCLSCHGDKLQGRVGPNTNLTKVGDKLSREQIAAQIANGSDNMPGFKNSLSETDIGTLADWLATKK